MHEFRITKSVTLEVYETVENAYLDTALDFAEMWTDKVVLVSGLEDYDNNSILKNGQTIAISEVQAVLRSILRGEFWCRLETSDGFIHVGWDFYMYIGTPKTEKEVIKRANSRVLFVEDFISPYHNK